MRSPFWFTFFQMSNLLNEITGISLRRTMKHETKHKKSEDGQDAQLPWNEDYWDLSNPSIRMYVDHTARTTEKIFKPTGQDSWRAQDLLQDNARDATAFAKTILIFAWWTSKHWLPNLLLEMSLQEQWKAKYFGPDDTLRRTKDDGIPHPNAHT